MRTNPFKDRFYKALSVVTLYAFVLHISIPAALAYGSLMHAGKRMPGHLPAIVNVGPDHYERKAVDAAAEATAVNPAGAMHSAATGTAGGPGQSEHSGMSLNTNDGLLNKFTGDMSYSIPLMDVEGFPITISYNPNVSMDQEASWVGLGWDLSLGSINRDMRGIPDDFSGDVVSRIFRTQKEEVDGYKAGPSVTVGAGLPLAFNYEYGNQMSGAVTYKLMVGSYYNNYTGGGYTLDLDRGVSSGILGLNFNRNKGYSLDNQNGIGRSKSFSFAGGAGLGIGSGGYIHGKTTSTNSRSGMKTVSKTTGFMSEAKLLGSGYGSSNTSGSFVTYGTQTYVPRFQFNRRGEGYSGSNSFGLSMMGVPIGSPIFYNLRMLESTYGNLSELLSNDNSLQAYGYYNLSKSKNNPNAMLDFNRDGFGGVRKDSKHLSVAGATQDMFYCSAPGLSSNYRAHRYEVFHLHDPEVTSHNTSDNSSSHVNVTGGFVATSNIIGVDVGVGKGTSTSESVSGKGDQHAHFSYVNPLETFDGKEYYLKSIGEMTPVDLALLNAYQGEKAVYMELEEVSGKVAPTNNIVTKEGSSFTLPAENKQLLRSDNITHYREFTGGEMEEYGMEVLHYDLYDCGRPLYHISNPDPVETVSAGKPAHLIGGIEAVNSGGMRYEFTTPAFSYKQKEVSFSASGLKEENESDYDRTGFVAYHPGDNSLLNDRGRQQMFDATTVPAYASTYLLTSMLSSDYVDRTLDGPTPDDQGNYYKINYSNVYGEADPYKWRMPMTGGNTSATFDKQPRLAYFQENLNTDPWDDVANYVYGEKDIWYGQSVESKNFVALFCLKERIDQFSAEDENGGLDMDKPGMYLYKIELYSRADLRQENIANAKPIQVVEFDYDYSLCQNYVGNKNSHAGYYGTDTGEGTGKLTLKRIYTYSGSSNEMKTVPVQFEYSTTNPDFAYNSTDRWGNYKPNNPALGNHIIPYSEQDKDIATENIQAWKLKKVKESSGAEMEFFYGVDEYTHVQHKRAMRMFNVVGMSDTRVLNDLAEIESPGTSDLFAQGVSENFRRTGIDHKTEYYDVIYFQLDTPIDNPDVGVAHEMVKQMYFADETGTIPDEFLFNMHSKLGKESDDRYETVQSMATLGKGLQGGSYIGVVGESGPFSYGYVVIQSEKINEDSDHYYVTPLQLANWQFARLNAPFTIYGTPDYDATTPQDFCDYSNSLDYTSVFRTDINKKINRLEYGNVFDNERSFIRLYEPDNAKIGGNARLVAIEYKDGWNAMSGEDESSYRWEYTYSPLLEEGTTTGVAAYEPKIGGDENPWYHMDAYSTERFRLPDEKSYQILPLGEMFFPAPVVGYGEVSTQFGNTNISIAKSVGVSVERYYTASDYPTLIDKTDKILKVDRTEDNVIKEAGKTKELVGFSEGFVVITNDYHGKIRETEVFDANMSKISGSVYKYHSSEGTPISYLHPNGTVTTSATPREIDMYTESWKTTQLSSTADQSVTTSLGAVFQLPFIFIPFLFVQNDLYGANGESEIQGFTFEKIINHSAVLASVENYTLGSSNTARNELFDPRSGDVLLSSLQDEFDDRLYSFSYPAHWKYDAFENMNQTDNALFTNISGTGSTVSVTSGLGLQLSTGDHLRIYVAGSFVTDAWVLEISGGNAKLIDEDGELLSGITWSNASIRVVRTGKKNILGGSMMAITTKNNPQVPAFSFPTTGIISSSASMLKENASVPCTALNGINTIAAFKNGTTNTTAYQIDEEINPFTHGLMGNYRPFGGFAFQNERTSFEDPNGIRKDGTLKNYVPFYELNSGNWYRLDEPGHSAYDGGDLGSWRLLGHVDEYSEWATSTQSTDQVNISQAGITAYNRELIPRQAASSVNASLREIGYDGFETYQDFHGGSQGVPASQFSLSEAFASGTTLSSSQRHSGLYSMKVDVSSDAEYATHQGTATPEATISGGKYLVRACNCISNFAPTPEKEYLLSAWVKEESGNVPYTQTHITVEYENALGATVGSQQIFTPDGPIIEGWQKIEGKYTIPAGAAKVRFIFGNTDAGASYFDDFRTHPFKAGMTSVVYHPTTLQPMAEHDGYNYTTFYNYDKNHQLVRIKVETIEGIQTISETESGTKRQN